MIKEPFEVFRVPYADVRPAIADRDSLCAVGKVILHAPSYDVETGQIVFEAVCDSSGKQPAQASIEQPNPAWRLVCEVLKVTPLVKMKLYFVD